MVRVLFWSAVPYAREAVVNALKATDGVEFEMVTTVDDCVAQVGNSDLLILGDAPKADALRVLEAADGGSLQSLFFISAGRDGFEAAGIPKHLSVSGAVGANAPTVAEHAVALALTLMRKTGQMALDTRERKTNKGLVRELRSLEGQEVLVVGLGNIGKEAAVRFQAFGARVTGLTRNGITDADVHRAGKISDIDTYLPETDVVVVTAALTPETRQIINAPRLSLMKPTAVLINVARGGLVDHEALADALSSHEIAAAGLDVTDPEPLPAEHPLWGCSELLVSPHIAGGGSQAVMKRVGLAVEKHLHEFARQTAPTS